METSEQELFGLLNRLTDILGEDWERKLMENSPPVSWDDLVTKEWAEAKFAGIRGEISRVEVDLSKEIAGLRTEVADLRTALAGQTEKIAGQSEKIAGLHTAIASQTRTMALMFAGFASTVCAALAGGIWFG